MTTNDKPQSGAVLIATLIMLVMMTLLVLSMLRTNVIQLKIGGASQVAAQTLANAEEAIWGVLNSPANRGRFFPGASLTIPAAANQTLTVTEVACISDAAVGQGNMLGRSWGVAHFNIEVDATDPVFSGRTIVHQGLRSILPAGACRESAASR